MNNPFVITIDGPAASGKGTLAKRLSSHYDLPYLDTGLMYRAIAHSLLAQQFDFKNIHAIEIDAMIKIARNLDFSNLNSDILSAHVVGEAASKIAVFPDLRKKLLKFQQDFSKNPAGAILDGRDIGTIVCPQANLKLYIVADVKDRAYRRYKAIINQGKDAVFDKIFLDLNQRDIRDTNRAVGALKPAKDAYFLDTTKLSIESTFQIVCRLIDKKRNISPKEVRFV